MLLSVIIPTCNRKELLASCLDLLKPGLQTLDPFFYEVIVTDDSSNKQTQAVVLEKYSWVKWVAGPQKGPASNRNCGAKYANGSWLVFLDDDCLPKQSLLENYKIYVEKDNTVKVLEGKITNNKLKESPIEYAPLNEEGGVLWSCNFAVEKNLFFSIGGFDENFKYPHLEDIDLRERLITNGQVINFCKNAEVIHPWRKVTDGKRLGRYQEMYYYYCKKKNQKPRVINLLKDILFNHVARMRDTKVSMETFTAIKVMVEHMIVVLLNFKKWQKKYT